METEALPLRRSLPIGAKAMDRSLDLKFDAASLMSAARQVCV